MRLGRCSIYRTLPTIKSIERDQAKVPPCACGSTNNLRTPSYICSKQNIRPGKGNSEIRLPTFGSLQGYGQIYTNIVYKLAWRQIYKQDVAKNGQGKSNP